MSYPLPRFLDLRFLHHEQGGGWSQQGMHSVQINLLYPCNNPTKDPMGVLLPPLYRFYVEEFSKEAPVCLQPGLGG